mgnify:CR=1 FL=1
MKIEDLIEKRNSNLSFRLLSHALFWILSFSSSYFLIKFSFDTYKDTPLGYWTPLRNILGMILVFYPLMYLVIPHFLKKRKWLFLISAVVLLTFLYVFFDAIGEKIVFHYSESCSLMALEHNPDFLSVIRKSTLTNILFKASNIQLYLH